ncbi:hypothetical protein KUTeg_023167 [Tegillarca granosa]|uniref:EF-hand domain-containing protein n=1 Tax=Tegillarca granosa TaxID=220873 RepID=A0ABQ9E1G1_TEGGR|nr:hypothetical protein KUTeg_023167 [Tegillarca granosa]
MFWSNGESTSAGCVYTYTCTCISVKGFDERVLHHLDVENPHTFEMKDLEKLIVKATKDLDELDQKRKKEFKEYEMEKEHERREHLKELPEEERKKEEAKFEEMKKKHKDHPKVHHPGSKKQLEEVWEEKDHMDPDTFDPKTFFKKHDLNGDNFLDYGEVESLFQTELDKVYDPENPEDDMEERYEEMNRMREHVMKEIDLNHDGMVSEQEFLDYSHNKDFEKDEGWDTLDEQEQYSEDDLRFATTNAPTRYATSTYAGHAASATHAGNATTTSWTGNATTDAWNATRNAARATARSLQPGSTEIPTT